MIYPEFLPDFARQHLKDNFTAFHDRYSETAKNHDTFLLLWDEMWKVKKANASLIAPVPSEEQRLHLLFNPRDLHWGVAAQTLQAQELVNAISPGLWDASSYAIDYDNFKVRQSEFSRIWLKTYLPEPYPKFRHRKKVEVVKTIKTNAPGKPIRFYRPAEAAPSPLKVLVIHDSFFGGTCINLTAAHFTELISIRWEILRAPPFPAMDLINQADVIVIQCRDGLIARHGRYNTLNKITQQLRKQRNS